MLQKRPTDICSKDEEFGRQMLAGFNPSVIKALKEVPSSFGSAITEDDVRGMSRLNRASEYVCDHLLQRQGVPRTA